MPTDKGITYIDDNADLLDGPADINASFDEIDALIDASGYAAVATSESRNNGTPGDLATVGPSVTVTVPTNGLVAIYASVAITTGLGPSGIVGIAEDGVGIGSVMVVESVGAEWTMYTAPGTVFQGTHYPNDAGWVVFPAAAGSRTYNLQYSTASGSVAFATRRLWVRVLPF